VATRRSARCSLPLVAVIEHLCAKPEHQLPQDVGSPIVMYAGAWGYCPAGAADDHDWRATGGRTLATVREWLGRPSPVTSLTR
jgi:hypothetical protein